MKKMENDSIVRTYSDWYLSLNETGKAKNSFVTWDLVHKCRKFERIMAWAVDVVRIPKFEDTPNMMHVNGHKHVSEKGQVVKDGEPGGFNAELEDGN